MKKIICIILVVVFVLSISVTPSFATTLSKTGKIYIDKFMEYEVIPTVGTGGMAGLAYYNEFYYHYDADGNVDWAMISACVNPVEDSFRSGVICGKCIESSCSYPVFSVGYGIYDVKADEFHSILGVKPSNYEGFEEYVWENIGVPVGDADGDGELSVLDATFIQQALAQLHKFSSGDSVYGGSLAYLSDYDRDGERTVMDATAIQMKLAQLDS